MARAIKCRGKRVDNGEWVTGWYLVYGKQHFITNFANRNSFLGGFERVIPESVGQYTGRKDKNEVEIYEGDIIVSEGVYQPCSTKLEGPEPYRDIGDVKWSDIYLGWFFMGDSLADLDPNECKIIGDKHTTPELLEGK